MLPRVSAVWPIDRNAAVAPHPWPGWPDDKEFAFVLTHDVEGAVGMSRVPALADLDESLGFRSSFNFIPEGGYENPAALRQRLVQGGFEVGVHDLYHDGKLYTSRESFRKHAETINRYLSSWGCSGFRSGFMHHNLDWLHEVRAEYDMSTFDTDPFEPQPDGVHTIFPFWVPSSSGSGFMELPYTLPQDSTIFLCLQEKTISTWVTKLDWIAAHGGMALLNVHPDYVSFENRYDSREFPVELYKQFLTYVRERYGGRYWSALPSQVARYCSSFKPLRTTLGPSESAGTPRPAHVSLQGAIPFL